LGDAAKWRREDLSRSLVTNADTLVVVEAMAMESEIRCRSCGYQLRGLTQSVCPECGRAFDLADPQTFESRPPEWRRRRKIRRAVALLALILIVAVCFPTKLIKGKITLQCQTCGVEQITYRWEPRLPDWVGLRLVGFHWRTGELRDPRETRKECQEHNYDKATGEIWIQTRSFRVSTSCDQGYRPFINDAALSPETTVRILRQAMNPKNTSMGTKCAPKAD
jgi:ribosomal protein L37E